MRAYLAANLEGRVNMNEISSYSALETIEDNAYRTVFRAKGHDPEQTVIIHRLKVLSASRDEEARFVREYDVICKLHIAGLLRIHGVHKCEGGYQLIVEDVQWVSLKRMISSQPLETHAFLEIAIRLSETLGSLHQENIIHGAVRPEHILVDSTSFQVKMFGFGIEALLTHENRKINAPEYVSGILPYTSPEQTGRMNRNVDYRTDMYSLGVTLYEALTGQLPFRYDDPMELIHAHIARIPRAPHEVNPRIPVAISEIIMRLLSKTAEERYQNNFGLMADFTVCRDELARSGRIAPFELGRKDISMRFNIPQKLVGREPEIARLLAVFNQVAGGRCEMMLVSGYPGIGKSALIHEIHKPIVARRGYYISGKYEQFRRDVPYNSIIQAFQNLMMQILTEDAVRIEEWKERLRSALGPNGDVITDVIPHVELLIGPQPETPSLGPEESQNRFNMVFKNFVKVFAQERHPLVLFLDDLQWADTASLNLIRTIMTDEDIRYLFIIGAYRHNETEDTHPLRRTLEEIGRNGGVFHEIFLNPLTERNVQDLILEIIKSDATAILPLARLVHDKTGGNPFFVNQFLKSLYDGGLLLLDPQKGWYWDKARIEQMQVTDNVVDLLAGKITRLKESTQEFLRVGACIGNRFDLETLSCIVGRPIEQVVQDVAEAIEEGLVSADAYFVFRHDRIQEAAYSLIPRGEEKYIHLKIGRLFLERVSVAGKEKKIFYIVNQLNIAKELIVDPDERLELAELNRIAAKRAKESNAYEPALRYIHVGMSLLPSDCWERHFDLAFQLHRELAECEYVNAHYEKAEGIFDLLLSKAATDADRVEIHRRKVVLYASMVWSKQAIREGLKGLAHLGEYIPEKPKRRLILKEMLLVRLLLRARKTESFLHLPEMTDSGKKRAMELLAMSLDSAYFVNPALLALIILKMVRLSITYGNSPSSAIGYCGYGMLLSGGLGDYPKGEAFAELSLKIHQRFHNPQLSCKLLGISTELVFHWRKSFAEIQPLLHQSFQKGVDYGDLNFVAMILSWLTQNSWMMGEKLPVQEKQCHRAIALLEPLRSNVRWIMHLTLGMIVGLRGEATDDPLDFSSAKFDEKRIKKLKNPTLPFWQALQKLELCIIFNEFSKTGEFVSECKRNLMGAFSVPIYTEFYFLYALVLIRECRAAHGWGRLLLLRRMKKCRKKLRVWAEHCPENYGHQYFLVSAEMERLFGHERKAADLYDQAVESARQNGILHHAALSNEYAAAFWLDKGKPKIAGVYRKEAHDLYGEWGAAGKVRQMRERYPELQSGRMVDPGRETPSREKSAGLDQMDYLTVVNSLQAISTEIVLENLLKRLMKTVIENAGAGRGFFISVSDERFTIEAETTVMNQEGGKEKTEAGLQTRVGPQLLATRNDLLLPVLNLVTQTRRFIVLDDATEKGEFISDPYVLRERPRSVLCLPVVRRNRLVGLLYLENNMAGGAFTPDRISVLELLSSQAAISLENAKLYENIKRAEERVKNLLETANEGFWEVDGKGYTVDVNPEMCRILGRRREEVIGHHIFEFGGEQSIAESKRQKESLQRGEKLSYETAARRPDGTEVQCLFKATPLFHGERQVGAFSMVSDITERKKAEKEIRKLNADLEKRVAERTLELKAMLKKVEKVNRHMVESIRYAKTLQQALLPDVEWVRTWLPESLFIWEPKDMIGGDFFHIEQLEEGFVAAVMDCTGHGVPGAFMTMIAASGLRTILRDEGCRDPAEILKRLNYMVKTSLQQDTGRAISDDGLDAAICYVESTTGELTYAGARLPLVVASNGRFEMIKGNRQSLGYTSSDLGFTYTNHRIQLAPEARVYLYTDGFVDQLGGLNRRRFSQKRFRELLAETIHNPFDAQRQAILKAFKKYKGLNEQQDDVTVVGFTLPSR